MSSDAIEVTVERIMPASAERAFAALIDKALIAQWMFGERFGRDETVLHIKNDPAPGGTFSFLVDRAGEQIDHVGRYLVVDPPRHLVFTWDIGKITEDSVVTITLTPLETGCRLILTHSLEPQWADYAERTRQGWTRMTGVLAEVLKEFEARIVRRLDETTLEVTRLLPGPVARVWAYLTEPQKRARWFAGGAMELSAGGAVTFEHDHDAITDTPEPAPAKYKGMEQGLTTTARIVTAEPPSSDETGLLVFDWTETDGTASQVTIRLEAAGEDTRLTLTHARLPETESVPVSAGWHAHLDILEDELAGRPRRAFWSPHMELEDFYERKGP